MTDDELIEVLFLIARPIRDRMEDVLRDTDEEGRYGDADRVYAVGLCDMYAMEVSEQIVQRGLPATTVRGWFREPDGRLSDHFWTLCANFVVDITADQFGMHLPRVLIGTTTTWPQYVYSSEKTAEWHRMFPAEP